MVQPALHASAVQLASTPCCQAQQLASTALLVHSLLQLVWLLVSFVHLEDIASLDGVHALHVHLEATAIPLVHQPAAVVMLGFQHLSLE